MRDKAGRNERPTSVPLVPDTGAPHNRVLVYGEYHIEVDICHRLARIVDHKRPQLHEVLLGAGHKGCFHLPSLIHSLWNREAPYGRVGGIDKFDHATRDNSRLLNYLFVIALKEFNVDCGLHLGIRITGNDDVHTLL